MTEVIVFAEGPTEVKFISGIIAPSLCALQVYVKAETLPTSKSGAGGALSFDRLKFYARNKLREKPETILTTFIDLYGLDTSFPDFIEAKNITDVYARTESLESALHQAIIEHVGCRPERFISHIQPYEFEGLLFSDVEALVLTEPSWNHALTKLQAVRASFETPEHINNSYETKPSKRLEDILSPKYKKTRHGPLAAEKITLNAMEQECAHFHGWMEKLRCLAQADYVR